MPAEDEGVARPSVRRSPAVAAILSGLFPGLGQLYNHQRVKAVLFLVAGIVAGFGPLSPVDIDIDLTDPAPGMRNVLLASLPFLAIALWAVVDAYRSAQHPADTSQ